MSGQVPVSNGLVTQPDQPTADDSAEVPSVFFAHNYADRAIVQRIADSLVALDVRTIVDEATLFLGESLLERVAATIGDRGYVAVALSPHSVNSGWVQGEVKALLTEEKNKGIVVVPLLVADCELPQFLEDRYFADFRRPEAFQESVDLIVRRLGLPDTFGPLKEIGAAWDGPIRFEPTELLELFLVFFDGSEVIAGGRPRAPSALQVPDDTRVAKLPLVSMARALQLDLGDGAWRVVHFESESPLRPQRRLRSEGVTSGDHLVVAVGRAAAMDADVIVQRVESVVQNQGR
jgi:hypothetical protein